MPKMLKPDISKINIKKIVTVSLLTIFAVYILIVLIFYFLLLNSGEEANTEIKHFIKDKNAKIAKSKYEIDGFWYDPDRFYKFYIDNASLEKFKKNSKLELIKTDLCEQAFSKWNFRWLWGPPDTSKLGCWYNGTTYLYKDYNSNYVYLYTK